MANTGKYYKVLKRMDGKLRSAIVIPPVEIQYKEDVRVEGEHGPLLTFERQLSALTFADRLRAQAAYYSNTLYEIWECKVENPRPVSRLLYYLEARNAAAVEEWWRRPPNYHHGSDTQSAPMGTVAVDALTLVRGVDK